MIKIVLKVNIGKQVKREAFSSKMSGTILENLSTKKLSILVGILMICQVVCFLIGGLVGKENILQDYDNISKINITLSEQLQYRPVFRQFWVQFVRIYQAPTMIHQFGCIREEKVCTILIIDKLFKICVCLSK